LQALRDAVPKPGSTEGGSGSGNGSGPMLTEDVGPEEIATVVSRWTGIPVSRLQQTEREKLLHLKEELHR
jgi:ATP-dependent Clp protease ATP-binding subunit ClpB